MIALPNRGSRLHKASVDRAQSKDSQTDMPLGNDQEMTLSLLLFRFRKELWGIPRSMQVIKRSRDVGKGAKNAVRFS